MPAKKKTHRLTFKHKEILLRAAFKFFSDKKARELEDAAQSRFLGEFVEDWEKNVEPHLNAIRHVTDTSTIHKLDFPDRITLKPGDPVKHELPSGKIVEREATGLTLNEPVLRPDVFATHYLIDMSTIRNLAGKASHGSLFGRMSFPVSDLPKPITLPNGTSCGSIIRLGLVSWIKDQNRYIVDGFAYSHCRFEWLSQRTIKSLIRYYERAEQRAVSETSLLHAIAAVIGAAVTFEEVLEIWPAAESVRNELAFKERQVNRALIALNSEDKALLCNYLAKSKKVEGGAGIACAA